MSVERALEGWEGVQRQGHDIADRIGSLAEGLGCMIQSHLNSSLSLSQSVISSTIPGWASDDATYGHFNDEHARSPPWHWPWIVRPPQRRPLNRVQFNYKRNLPKHAEHETPEGVFSISQGASELGQRLEQAGAGLTACIRGFVHAIAKGLSLPFKGDSEMQLVPQPLEHDARLEFQGDYMPWREVNVNEASSGGKVRAATWKRLNNGRSSGVDESQAGHVQSEIQDVSNEELFASLNKWQGRLHRQGSVNMTTTFNSRTQEIESSVVARGDLWRAEVSHGGSNSTSGSSPLFLLQVGPILFVRDTTLLLPIHLSKQHLLWYGFDRKNGLHSLCPAVWSKHRRWLLMSMICLNQLTCTFMDLQFPNGQLTYVAGEGLTSSAFFRAFGGLIQAQSRQPGDTKISFSKKMSWGTQITPSLQLPEKSLSFGVVQPLGWHRSGVMVKPRVQLSVTPTIGGRNAGWRAELSHSLRERLSWACGCALTIEPTAYVSIELGKSAQKGGYSGSTGVIIVVETPVENLRRASVSVQLNNDVEF